MSTTDNLQSEKLEPCKWCADGDVPHFLDQDGTKVSATGNEGVLSHAYDVYWWPCLKFGVELRCSRAPIAVPQGDSEAKAKEIVEEYKQRVMQLPSGDAVPCAKWLETRLRIAFDLAAPASSPVPEQIVKEWEPRINEMVDDLIPATPTPVEQEQKQGLRRRIARLFTNAHAPDCEANCRGEASCDCGAKG